MEQEIISLGEYWSREIGWLPVLISVAVISAHAVRKNIVQRIQKLPSLLRITGYLLYVATMLYACVITALLVATTTAHPTVIILGGPAAILSSLFSSEGTMLAYLIISPGVLLWLVATYQLKKSSIELNQTEAA